uniref:Vacuolar protein 8 n=1 Tax=Leptocylindrus danicus TaxID=163516 RepID=A0A7S2LES5_9STRA|mmetsp:Transcript_4731/g.6890  ORF Transcript_4731/g.6890 Transcript_4731/m.6890 type:complete len:396 (+) Transcript_4731:40-1227(+)
MHTHKIIEGLNRSICKSDRIAAVKTALREFSHEDEARHDEEIQLGAANALYQKLALAMFQHHTSEEIGIICESLHCVYFCSLEMKETSFREIGKDLVHLLTQVIAQCLEHKIRDETHGIMENSLGVLVQVSFVHSAEVEMANRDAFLDQMLQIIHLEQSKSNSNKALINVQASALSVISNLAFRKENQVMMTSYPGLVDALIDCATSGFASLRRPSLGALCHLAGSGNVEASAQMVQNEKLIRALSNLLVDDNEKTREHAAGTLNNLSVIPQNSVQLVGYGFLLDALMEVFANKIGSSSDFNNSVDESSWKCATCAFMNLVHGDTALVIAKRRGLLDVLATIAAMDDVLEVRETASHALKIIAMNLVLQLDHYGAGQACGDGSSFSVVSSLAKEP